MKNFIESIKWTKWKAVSAFFFMFFLLSIPIFSFPISGTAKYLFYETGSGFEDIESTDILDWVSPVGVVQQVYQRSKENLKYTIIIEGETGKPGHRENANLVFDRIRSVSENEKIVLVRFLGTENDVQEYKNGRIRLWIGDKKYEPISYSIGLNRTLKAWWFDYKVRKTSTENRTFQFIVPADAYDMTITYGNKGGKFSLSPDRRQLILQKIGQERKHIPYTQ